MTDDLSLEGVNLLWEGKSTLSGLLSDSGGILGRQGSSQSSGLLGSQVLRDVLLAGVQGSDVLSLVGVDDSQDTGNVLSDDADVWDGRLGQLLHLQGGQLLLQLQQLLLQLLLGLGSQLSGFDRLAVSTCWEGSLMKSTRGFDGVLGLRQGRVHGVTYHFVC